MPPKPKPNTLGIGDTTPTTTPTTTPAPGASGGFTVPSSTAAGPTTTEGTLGISTTDQNAPSPEGTKDFLGLGTGPAPTIGGAAAYLSKLSTAKIAQIQSELRNAGILTGKYRAGIADAATRDAFISTLAGAAAGPTGTTLQDYISNYAQSSEVKAATTSTGSSASPETLDPAAAEVQLQSAFATYGLGNPTAGEVNQLMNQYASAKASNVDANVSDEAQVLAAEKAGSTPGATNKVDAASDADIDKAAAAMGVDLNDRQRANILAQVTANAKATGSPDVNLLNQLVARQFKMPTDPSKLTGDAATVQNDLQKLAGQYLVPTSATTIANFVTKAIRNQSYAGSLTGDTEAEFEQWLRTQAGTLYPWLKNSTQDFQTVNPWDATSAYRTQISNVLGLGNPDAVDLTSKQYAPLLKSSDGVNPPSLQDIDTSLMTDPQYGYDSSPNGISRGYNVGLSLAKSLGVNIGGI